MYKLVERNISLRKYPVSLPYPEQFRVSPPPQITGTTKVLFQKGFFFFFTYVYVKISYDQTKQFQYYYKLIKWLIIGNNGRFSHAPQTHVANISHRTWNFLECSMGLHNTSRIFNTHTP